MKTLIAYYTLLAATAGVTGAGIAYSINRPQEQPQMAPSYYRATTVTGRGQFKCQTDCQLKRN
jgi:hypothetical protein